jgi:hypothetical protein
MLGARRKDEAMTTPSTLDDLAALSSADLGALYAQGGVPADFSALDKHPRGRMLAVRGVEKTPIKALLGEFAKLGLFPWDGKSMTSTGTQTGEGVNRINLGPIKQTWFTFTTSVQTSIVDGQETIVLNYEHPGNPAFIRKIHDEIREVAPGLYLGPAMWKTGDTAKTVLWFALDTNTPSA